MHERVTTSGLGRRAMTSSSLKMPKGVSWV